MCRTSKRSPTKAGQSSSLSMGSPAPRAERLLVEVSYGKDRNHLIVVANQDIAVEASTSTDVAQAVRRVAVAEAVGTEIPGLAILECVHLVSMASRAQLAIV